MVIKHKFLYFTFLFIWRQCEKFVQVLVIFVPVFIRLKFHNTHAICLDFNQTTEVGLSFYAYPWVTDAHQK